MIVRHYKGGLYRTIGTTKNYRGDVSDLDILMVAGHTEEHLRDVYVFADIPKKKMYTNQHLNGKLVMFNYIPQKKILHL